MWSLTAVLSATTLLLVLRGSSGIEVGEWQGFSQHQITGTISFPTPNTVAIDNFSYDNGGVTVFFYYYALGQAVDGSSGVIVGNELNRRFTNEQVVVTLPDGVTACDIGFFTVWCQPFGVTFSRIEIPRSVFLNEGEGECQLVGGNTDLPEAPVVGFDNCEPFFENLQVSWTVDNDNSEVDFQLCGCRPLDPGVNQYMAFGLSGSADATFMIGADPTVAWVDNAVGMPNAVDYYNTARLQCRAGEGACPDTLVSMNGENPCTDDVRSDSIQGGIRNGNQQCVLFSRPFVTNDDICDTNIDPNNTEQYIVWANGGLGETAFIHFTRAEPSSPPIHLGRTPLDQCSSSIMCPSCPPFIGKTMDIPFSTTLQARIGPSGRERGYMGITGQVGWGISWYIDDVLAPVLIVERGSTYTFIVEGGNNAMDLARFHPFYITSSRNGGRLQNEPDVMASETVFAGFDAMDNPTGVGRLCEYFESSDASNILDSCGTFEAYLNEITSTDALCDATAQPGMLVWTPDDNTPNEVFYQCGTHLNLGWRIVVNDAGTSSLSSAKTTPTLLPLTAVLLVSLATLFLGAS